MDETIKVAKQFLEDNLDIAREYGNIEKSVNVSGIGQVILSKFLGWNESKVAKSLKRIKLINEGKVTKLLPVRV